jgi:hypothetical protein
MRLRDGSESASQGFVLAIALLALVAAAKPILYGTLDPDCFWHLRVADQLHRDGIGPLVDDISFASIKTPWTPYSWLAELGMKAIWDAGGYRAAVFVQALMMAGLVVLIAQACRERADSPIAVLLATVAAMYWSLPYLSFRPVTFALVMLALCAWLMIRDRRLGEASRAAWCVVPIAALLANVHFFAFFVPAALAVLMVDATRKRRAAVLLLLTLVAACATPMLPGVIRSIAHYQFADPMLRLNFVAEFQPFYAGTLGWISILLLLAILGLAIRNRGRLRPADWILLMGAITLLIRLGRFAPVFAIVAAPILAITLPRMSGAALARKPVIAALATVVVIGIVRIVTSFPIRDVLIDQWLNRLGDDTPGYPCAAARFVEQNICPVRGRLVNEFSWGGYLAWRFAGHFQVLMDGRTQLYRPEFWEAVYASDRPDLNKIADADARADAAILPIDKSRLRANLMDRGWKSVYRDGRAEVLVPAESPLVAGVSE